jgi:hypothetical protein
MEKFLAFFSFISPRMNFKDDAGQTLEPVWLVWFGVVRLGSELFQSFETKLNHLDPNLSELNLLEPNLLELNL